ncbi:MAG: lipopolysaccharide biosynthesis protein [Clostridia bacterium]|nr:lipopolysaccharide biosynthesis protein [Clostridia bacterium]
MEIKRNRVLSSMVWRFAERTGAQGVQLIVSIILARLLTPSDYGTVALLTVFISIANVFVDCGFGNSLVQKLNADDIDFSSVFFFNIGMGIILYIVLFLASPFIADFYHDPNLTSVLRVMALSLIIGGIKSVQQAHIQKRLEFKKFFFSTAIGTIISAVVGIVMAYRGFGVWALVAQNMTNSVIDTIVVWIASKWWPKLVFSIKRMRSLFGYGGRLLVSGLLDTIYNNMYSLTIGKFYSAADLGLYNKGKSYPMLLVENINSTIQSVLFPVMAATQENINAVKQITRRSIMTSTFVIFAMMAGMAGIAKSFTVILLTEKWLGSVIYLQLCCFIYALWPIHTTNLAAIRALGRSDIFLKLEIIKKIIGMSMLIVTIPLGVKAMVIGSCVSSVLSSFINASPNKKLLNYSYFEQIKDILPSFILSIVMMIVVLSIQFFGLNVWITLILQIIVGFVVYFGLAKLFKLECLEYVINTVKGLKKNN